MTNAQLDNDKQKLTYEVDLLKDRLADTEEHAIQLEQQLTHTSRVWQSICYQLVLESPQSRPHWLLLIYSFQFRSAFRASASQSPTLLLSLSLTHRHLHTCGFNISSDLV